MKKIVTKDELKNMVLESFKRVVTENSTLLKDLEEPDDLDSSFDPYNYSFGTEEEDFNDGFDSEEEANFHRELIQILDEGEEVFKKMKEVIENSDYYINNQEDERIKAYIQNIDKILDIIKNYWYE